MRKPIFTVFIISILLLSVLSILNYNSNIKESNRKEFNSLIDLAKKVYSNNITLKELNYTFDGKEINNKYEMLEHILLKAEEIDDTESSLKFSIASTYFYQNKLEEALDVYLEIIETQPTDFNAGLLAATMYKTLDKQDKFLKQMDNLETINKEMTFKYINHLNDIDDLLNMNFNTSYVKDETATRHAFIILGYALTSQGKMQDIMYERLNTANDAIQHDPNSLIIVSGGAVQNKSTEAEVMFNWLVENKIEPYNIYMEDKSLNTVENAQYTAEIVYNEDITDITVITSETHMHRAMAIFHTVFAQNIDNPYNINSISNLVATDSKELNETKKVPRNEELEIYRDVIRASGIELFPIFN